MLHPDKELVETIVKDIPIGNVATIDSLCQRLARDHNTDVICPMRTGNLVKAVMETSFDSSVSIPCWRVIRKNHMLINLPFIALYAENLEKEGFQVSQTSKGEFKVLNAKDRLFTFL